MKDRIVVGSGRSADPVEQAMLDGKLSPESVPAWRGRFAKDPKKTTATLASLAPAYAVGWVHEGSLSAAPTGPEDYPAEWLTETERARAGVGEQRTQPAYVPPAPPIEAEVPRATAGPDDSYPQEWLRPDERERPKRALIQMGND